MAKRILQAIVTAVIVIAATTAIIGSDTSYANKGCGSFHQEGLMTDVHVTITKGDFPCRIARRVMKRLFDGRDVGNWDCVGPQTGYARCEKRNRGVVKARF